MTNITGDKIIQILSCSTKRDGDVGINLYGLSENGSLYQLVGEEGSYAHSENRRWKKITNGLPENKD